jgi:hypothetical protein
VVVLVLAHLLLGHLVVLVAVEILRPVLVVLVYQVKATLVQLVVGQALLLEVAAVRELLV